MDVLEQVEQLLASEVVFDDRAVKLLLTDLLAEPVSKFAVRERVGRFALVDYTPITRPDPDIMLLTGPEGARFNAAVLLLQRHRAVYRLTVAEWYAVARRLLLHIEAALNRVAPDVEEREFVMAWATDVVTDYRMLPRPEIGW